MAGDVGFDPLEISSKVNIQWLREVRTRDAADFGRSHGARFASAEVEKNSADQREGEVNWWKSRSRDTSTQAPDLT